MQVLWIIIGVMALLYGCMLLWYRHGWKKLELHETGAQQDFRTPISVIIPARNEADNIDLCLKHILQQDYPSHLLEVIVVNDHSTDNTPQKVQQYISQQAPGLPRIKIIHLSEYLSPQEKINSYKKKAIETAVNQAEGELIVTTDADCIMGPQWIKTIAAHYEKHDVKFIAAPVSFYKESSFFKIFQSLDFMTMQGITGATIQLHSGTMCNGANLAYEKQTFIDVGGFQGVDCIASGDDMLLMYKVYKAYPDKIGFVKSPEAVVQTLPAEGWRAFLQQRIRWASKAGHYDDKRITAVLAFIYLWNVLAIGLLIAGFFNPVFWLWCLGVILYKTLVEICFLFPVAHFFQKSRLLWSFFPAQFLHIPYIVIAGWLGKFGHYKWKGRTVK